MFEDLFNPESRFSDLLTPSHGEREWKGSDVKSVFCNDLEQVMGSYKGEVYLQWNLLGFLNITLEKLSLCLGSC